MTMDLSERLRPTHRPDRPSIGRQRWQQLCFVHWRVPAKTLQPLIPASLEIDTFDGDAWLGLVPFYMSHVRPRWSPAIPWISNFCETNLRTYVHRNGREPGVWFFSLDAARLLPVLIARKIWKLNYYWAKMKIDRKQDVIQYTSQRYSNPSPASVQLTVEVETDRLPTPSNGYEESLEFFLAERYLLYTKSEKGMMQGQVHHQPYPLTRAKIKALRESISNAAGCPMVELPDHVLFSEGVDVEIFPLKRIDGTG